MILKIRRFLCSPAFLLIPLMIGCVGLAETPTVKLISMLTNAYLVAFVLFVSDDLLPALLPAFCVIIIGATLLETLTVVIPYIPLALPVAIGFVFHLAVYRRAIRLGPSFLGLVASSAAILLSGIGTDLSTREYTSLASFYHFFGLSVGLILLYLLFAMNHKEERGYDHIHYFLSALLWMGVLCAGVILCRLLPWLLSYFSQGGEAVPVPSDYFAAIPYRNTIANLGVMCIPAGFYLAGRCPRVWTSLLFFIASLIIYLGAVLTFARTAMLFGTLLLLICLVYCFFGRCPKKAKLLGLLLLGVSIVCFTALLWEPLSSLLSFRIHDGWISMDEARARLLLRSFSDFKAHPIFGIGITSTANSDIYNAPGCICWYHLYLPQIWGSMGLCGLCAYGFQLFVRAKLIFTRPDYQGVAMGLVYLGLLLYSQTDPGEFAPIPYAVLAVALFAILDGRHRKLFE